MEERKRMAELETTNRLPPLENDEYALQDREGKTAGECPEAMSTNTCRELVSAYSSDRPQQLSWEADKAWYGYCVPKTCIRIVKDV